ncbi:hypothetical protein BWI17_14580 [Betaproteobacteria bacterium GR16-43]|nr:hypothetical protein BWI17_14580 [Betaproteobacteria bacterium GR16-43]
MPKNLGAGLGAIYEDYLQTTGAIPQTANRAEISAQAASYREDAVMDSTGRFRVMLYLTGDKTLAQVVQSLGQSKGFEIVGTSDRYRHGVIDGWLEIGSVAAVAGARGVNSVMLQIQPEMNVGLVTQQGVVQHRVDQIAGPGFDGTGITVGVMSDTFNFSTNPIKAPNDVASGDLPGAGNPLGNLQDVVIIQERATQGTDEGRAMTQLVHDIAPKARLGFATAGSSQLQFADNIRSLAAFPGAPRIVPGFKADIIVDDVIFLTENMFSDGIVAQAVNDVTSTGTHYFSSAGNRASSGAYAANFNFVNPVGTPTAGSNINLTGVNPALFAGGFHNFRTDGGQDIAQTIRRTGGATSNTNNARVVLQWDDPFDLIVPGTQVFTTSSTFTGTPATLDVPVTLTGGLPTRIVVTAINGSAYDAIVSILNPSNAVVVAPVDTGTDETIFFTPSVTGTYTVRLTAFNSTTGDFSVTAFENSSQGITTEYNVLWFRPDTGAFISSSLANAFIVNEPFVFASSIPFPAGQSTVQMVIARSAGSTANRLKYVLFDNNSSVRPDEYISYQYPVTYGHNSTANGHGVAALSAFRPYIPENFTSPGPVTILFDAAGNRLVTPEIRQQPVITAMDGGNTTFFSGDSQGDFEGPGPTAGIFPNFFGTSAAAPNAAAIAALVLQAKGGPGSLTVAQMKNILINSAIPNDLDPNHAEAVIKTNGGTLTITLDADYTNSSATTSTLPLIDPNVFKVSYSGAGAVASITLNGTNGNTTGGNNTVGVAPGMVFDTRAIASSGLPFTLGTLVGLVPGDITTVNGPTAPAPAVAGESFTLTINLGNGTFTNGKSFAFNVDRDELNIFAIEVVDGTTLIHSLATFGPQIGNSADLFGANVAIPQGTISPGGVTVTGTMQDGTAFSGVFRNKIGTGYSPLSGYGFLNAQRAVALAANTTALTATATGTGTGTITSSVAGLNCANNCVADFTSGSSFTVSFSPAVNSAVSNISGCDGVLGVVCFINNLSQPRTVSATFTAFSAPDSPIIGTATAGNGQVSVSFTPPAYDGLSAITGYSATCGAVTVAGPSSPIVVSPLPNGAAVTCTARAINAIGTSPPSMPSNSATPTAPAFVKGDFDGNGKGDLLFRNADGRGAIWLMNGLTIASSAEIFPAGTNWAVAQIADLNGDGKADLVWANPDGRVTVYLMDGTTATTKTNLLPAGGGWSVAGAGDLDGDGKSDIVFQNADGTVAAYLMNGSTVTSGATILGAGTGWSVTLVADFDGDGKKDLFFQHTDGRAAIYLMNGLTPTATVQILNAGTGWTATHTADLNGDGKADIVWHNADGRTAVWLMNGTTMTSGTELLGAATGWAVTRVGDFDGDGKSDLVFEHTDGRVAIYLMNGITPTATTQILNAGGGWTVKRLADVNGDGKADIIWENVDGSLAIWLMNGTTTTSGAGVLGPGTGWAVSPVSQ